MPKKHNAGGCRCCGCAACDGQTPSALEIEVVGFAQEGYSGPCFEINGVYEIDQLARPLQCRWQGNFYNVTHFLPPADNWLQITAEARLDGGIYKLVGGVDVLVWIEEPTPGWQLMLRVVYVAILGTAKPNCMEFADERLDYSWSTNWLGCDVDESYLLVTTPAP